MLMSVTPMRCRTDARWLTRGRSKNPCASALCADAHDRHATAKNEVARLITRSKLSTPLWLLPLTPLRLARYHGAAVGVVVKLVITLPCHGRGRGFESHPPRRTLLPSSKGLGVFFVVSGCAEGDQDC